MTCSPANISIREFSPFFHPRHRKEFRCAIIPKSPSPRLSRILIMTYSPDHSSSRELEGPVAKDSQVIMEWATTQWVSQAPIGFLRAPSDDPRGVKWVKCIWGYPKRADVDPNWGIVSAKTGGENWENQNTNLDKQSRVWIRIDKNTALTEVFRSNHDWITHSVFRTTRGHYIIFVCFCMPCEFHF